ncbi:MAG: 16S rRNA (guanine(527)-N(7))-methyltransferase RsmG [Acidobacteria bacterium]|nr:16S rRNA (guanine(527)-N(7))-methyltransferase RsmG [Acidobacteriota bacterium]MYJ03906.1 16S rRNA (guanine(527)-N(7))-methyltransferase RsmG [Acidobacteriota bacterium]
MASGEQGATGTDPAQLVDRASLAGVAVGGATAQTLAIYLDLVRRWNARMNLTALDGPDQAIDRLIVEPLAAARHIPLGASVIDIGSGNGSPAIPLRIARPDLVAVRLVESRMRRGVFLREVIRELRLDRVVVENDRYEALLEDPALHDAHDALTLRGVAWDVAVLSRLQRFLRPGGLICLFASGRADGQGVDDLGLQPPLVWHASAPLGATLGSRLIMVRVDR